MSKYVLRTVTDRGVFVGGVPYWDECLRGHHKELVGVYWDEKDRSAIEVLDIHAHRICTAKAVEAKRLGGEA